MKCSANMCSLGIVEGKGTMLMNITCNNLYNTVHSLISQGVFIYMDSLGRLIYRYVTKYRIVSPRLLGDNM